MQLYEACRIVAQQLKVPVEADRGETNLRKNYWLTVSVYVCDA
jgi:hypothetical protein